MKSSIKKIILVLLGTILYICSIKISTQLSIADDICIYVPEKLQYTGKEVVELVENFECNEDAKISVNTNFKKRIASNPILNRSGEVEVGKYGGTIQLLFSEGRNLQSRDKEGCYIDSQTAYKLFGSTDVVGEHIVIENQKYKIRQVFSNPANTVFIQILDDEQVDISEIRIKKPDNLLSKDYEQILLSKYDISGKCLNLELLEWINKMLLLLVPIMNFKMLHLICKKNIADSKIKVERCLMRILPIIVVIVCLIFVIKQSEIPEVIVIHKISEFELWMESISKYVRDIREIFSMGKNNYIYNYCKDFFKSFIFLGCSIINWGQVINLERKELN